MAKHVIYSNIDTITCPDSSDNYLVSSGIKDSRNDQGNLVAKITVTSSSGGIKFSSIGNASLSARTIAQDETVYITLGVGDELLYFKADAENDTFDIEI